MAELTVIAKMHTDFPEKFGIPRQSGLVKELRGMIVFEEAYRNPDALRGIEEFSHLWILWNFSKAKYKEFTPLVTPPRLGGKEKRGVFATRSPFRPNSIGLSSVKLEEVKVHEKYGTVLIVSGADLMDQTPIYDIKPYLPYTDCHTEAIGGFGEAHKQDCIEVRFPEKWLKVLPEELQVSACKVLEQDPRAAYNKKPDYVYGMEYGGYDIRFTVIDHVLEVQEVISTHRPWSKVK